MNDRTDPTGHSSRGADRSLRPLLPPSTLGMLGGGQLGRYFVMAAHELGYRVWVLDPDEASPAGRIADRHIVAGFDDPAATAELAAGCVAVSTEFENVPAATMHSLAERTVVYPSAAAVAIAQDRIAEKSFLLDSGIPVGPVAFVRTTEDLDGLADDLFPAVLKTATLGYDGKGQRTVAGRREAEEAFVELGSVPCVVEKLLPLDLELSVVLARSVHGEVACFATAENRHRDGILDVTITPARIPYDLDVLARATATRVAEALDYVGVLAVEMFVVDDRILVNEMAPRPHNSGHVTLDSTVTSQFEQQVRALCRLPLGSSRAHSAAVMVNLLGDLWPAGEQPPWPAVTGEPDLKLHLYGKLEPRPGRKMGHMTLLGGDVESVLEAALRARSAIGIREDP
ncbi:MAG: 5-(carboxyamino)imidazole ribonucleotide synthase [Acidimicrobiales bacterium]|nr:5-(carboxyamino)imidazole ribonucleotide synthase [Acidimicrobiales bacterium]